MKLQFHKALMATFCKLFKGDLIYPARMSRLFTIVQKSANSQKVS